MNKDIISLETALWGSADSLRGKMNASDYMNYLLGLVFYKHLSDRQLRKFEELMSDGGVYNPKELDELQLMYEEMFEEAGDVILDEIASIYTLVLTPEQTFNAMLNKITNKELQFQLTDLKNVFKVIETSDTKLNNIFQDFDIDSTKLGTNPTVKNETIASVMKKIGKIDTTVEGTVDNLGDVYEYLLGKFASDNNGGEFYTPKSVSDMMSRIVTKGKEDSPKFKIADFTMGSGSLMLNAKKYMDDAYKDSIVYFGQELNGATYNLAKMNLILHGVSLNNQKLNHGDTLEDDWTEVDGENYYMDAVVMNPPYSLKWKASETLLEDIRFSEYGVLPPKSKADLAFLLHGLSHLEKENGKMAIVLPHGVLFRGASEGKIRQKLLENGNIEAVIGLPSNIFFNTGIPTTVLILSKNRQTKDVYFIDASNEFEKQKAQNVMLEKHINHIVENYFELKEEDKFSRLVPFKEIVENDYNLNIPRYIDTFEEEPEVPLEQIMNDLNRIDYEIEKSNEKLLNFMNDMVGTDEESNKELENFIKGFI